MSRRNIPNVVSKLDTNHVEVAVDKDTDDTDFIAEQRKRKIEIARLDHRFRKITHPYFLLLYMLIIAVVYGVAWTIGIVYDLPRVLTVAAGIKSLLSYLATAVFSFLLSRFMEDLHKRVE